MALAVVGCGGDSEPVTVQASGAALAAVQVDGGSWQPLELDADGEAIVDADGPFAVAVVCDTNGFFNYYTIYAGPGATPLWMQCWPPATVDLTIETASPTTRVWGRGFGDLGGGISVAVDRGTHDFVAIDDGTSPPRFEIRRDVTIDEDTTLELDDLRVSGAPMNAAAIEVSGADPSESLLRTVWLVTPNASAYYYRFDSGDSSMPVFPPDALVGTDEQTVEASVRDVAGDVGRSARRRITGDETSVALALPPALGPVTPTFGDEITVTWENDHDWTSTYFYVHDDSFAVYWDVMVLPSYVAAGGAPDPVRIPDPGQLPGWDPAWAITDSTGLGWSFEASRSDGPSRTSASRSGSF